MNNMLEGFSFLYRFVLLSFSFVLLLAAPAFAKDSVLDIQEVQSPGGVNAWLVEDHSIPVIALKFSFQGAGSSNETEATQGLARIASNTMDEGAGDLDSQAFQKELQDLSISLRFSAGRDDFGGSLKTLSVNKDRAFELLKMALAEPRFDDEPLGRMVAANQSRIRSSLSDPNWIAARIMNDKAYAGHPYALNSGGTLSTLGTITPDMLRDFVKTQLTRDRLKIGAAGDITPDELGALVDDLFGSLPEKSDVKAAEDFELQNTGELIVYERDIPQTVIEMNQPGIARTDDDYQYAVVLNYILGSSGFGSRLMEEVREKQGLTYGIYSSLSTMDNISTLSVSTSTANKNAGKIVEMVNAEWDKMLKDGINEEELKAAQDYLIGSLPLSLTSTDAIAGLLLSIQVDDFPINYLDIRQETIKNATVNDIERVASRLLDPEKFIIVMVGQPDGITPTAKIETIPNAE